MVRLKILDANPAGWDYFWLLSLARVLEPRGYDIEKTENGLKISIAKQKSLCVR